MEELKEKWDRLVALLSERFADGDEMDVPAIVFLVGVNELGQGYRRFKKDEKVDLIHIGLCQLLSRYGYYEFEGEDEEGWPHWKATEKLPQLSPGQQNILVKEALVLYFEERGDFIG